MLDAVAGGAADSRAAARSNVFLAATLVAAGTPSAVRIRNISAKGALLEGPALPQEGSAVQLRRGSLSVDGEVAWRDSEQCGVRLSADVVVEDWVRRVGHAGQQRVDKIVTVLRRPPFPDAASLVLMPGEDSLAAIGSDLTDVCERLSTIPLLVESHSGELLRLDAIAQRLGQLRRAEGDAP